MTRKTRLIRASLIVAACVIAVLIAYPGMVLGSGLFATAPVTVSAGLDSSLDVAINISAPSNGSFLQVGETAEITVTLKDQSGASLSKADLSTLGLYAYGPQETAKTVTAVKLLNATTDRTKTPHHYIDLLTNSAVRVEGNALKYTLQPVTDEEPGTYTATVRAVRKGSGKDQMMALVDFQLGTATVEKQIVEKENCAACHQGASSGQFYFAHADPGRSPYGSPSLENLPVRTCKSCHNNDGYAAFVSPVDGTRVPDQIVRRVHGIHMGEELKNLVNTDPKTGVFRDYTAVVFPANVKNCTSCHVDDRWQTQASRLACGTCHDNVSFAETASVPASSKAHPGGPQANDAACSTCHTAKGTSLSVVDAHKVEPPAFKHTVELALSTPANGSYYVTGERPTVTITVKDVATGATIDPRTMVEPADAAKVQANEWRRAYLFVSGPRRDTRPVLTTAAAGSTATYAGNELRVLRDASKADPRITRTDTSIVYQLDDVAGLLPGTYTAWVETMPSAPLGGWAVANFQVGGPAAESQVATNCASCHGDTRMHGSYFSVQFNPDICKSCHDYERQLTGKSGWSDSNNGFGAGPLSRRVHGVHFGRYLDKPGEVHATVDYSEVIFPQDVRNCTKCHDSKATTAAWKEKPSRLACMSCHDSDAANAHAKTMTFYPSPADQWSGNKQEACATCHGPGRDFAVEKMHKISNPYMPPYPREPEG